jgi:hypothetical protein
VDPQTGKKKCHQIAQPSCGIIAEKSAGSARDGFGKQATSIAYLETEPEGGYNTQLHDIYK